MTLILAWLASNPTVIMIVGGIAAALGYGYQQRRAGAKAAVEKRDRKAFAERHEMHREATEQERRAAGMSDEELDRRLSK